MNNRTIKYILITPGTRLGDRKKMKCDSVLPIREDKYFLVKKYSTSGCKRTKLACRI